MQAYTFVRHNFLFTIQVYRSSLDLTVLRLDLNVGLDLVFMQNIQDLR